MVGSVREVPESAPYRNTSDDIEAGAPHTDEKVVDHDNKVGSEPGITTYNKEDGVSDSSRVGSVRDDRSEDDGRSGYLTWPFRFLRRHPWIVHGSVVILFTAWWIYGLIHHRHDHYGWLKPFLVYLGIMIRIITFYVPTSVVMNPARFVWNNTVYRVYEVTPSKLRQPIAAVVTVAVFLIGTMVPEETGDNTRANRAVSLCGLIVMILLLTVTSRNWRLIPWHTVIGGMLSQFIVAVFVLRTKAGYDIFSFISYLARTLLSYAQDGVVFLTDSSVPNLPWFFTGVIPPIIFFVSLVQLLYHLGFIQWFIGKFAVFFFWTLRVSGAEAVVAAATPFIGQGESAMLIRPFVPHLTLSEIHQVMTCGFATISGSVLVAYIGLGLNPQALVSSCIMSIPAALAVSKMRFPETEETLTSGKVVVPEDQEHKAANWIHAFANGAWLGIKIAGMIIATLLCIIGLVSLVNGLLGWWGAYFNISDPPLTLQLILGYILYPVAKLLGVENADVRRVGELIGQKIIINEFAAFNALATEDVYKSMSDRSKLIATYACCGFGNIGSLGTQIGVLSQIAPGRAGDVSRVALSALFSGILATLTSASVAGMLFQESMKIPGT